MIIKAVMSMFTAFGSTNKLMQFRQWLTSKNNASFSTLIKIYIKMVLCVISSILTVLMILLFLLEDERLQNLPDYFEARLYYLIVGMSIFAICPLYTIGCNFCFGLINSVAFARNKTIALQSLGAIYFANGICIWKTSELCFRSKIFKKNKCNWKINLAFLFSVCFLCIPQISVYLITENIKFSGWMGWVSVFSFHKISGSIFKSMFSIYFHGNISQ